MPNILDKLHDIIAKRERFLDLSSENSNGYIPVAEIESIKLEEIREVLAQPDAALERKVTFGSTKLSFPHSNDENFLNLENDGDLKIFVELITLGQIGISEDTKKEIYAKLKDLPKYDFDEAKKPTELTQTEKTVIEKQPIKSP